MVDFNTRVFTEEDGKIIGAEITVYSDSGDKLGLIDVADATTLNWMQEQLTVIDETYFTEERLEELLSNASEAVEINATLLNGFNSSYFAKASQLNNYALVNHTHSKVQITDLYNYEITASDYNVDIDGSVTLTVRVTNQSGAGVTGVSVPVSKNGVNWQSGITGVNGYFNLTYTASEWGIVTFSAGNASVQVNVKGWKLVQTIASYIKVYTDGLNGYIEFDSGSTNITRNAFNSWGTVNEAYRPRSTGGETAVYNWNASSNERITLGSSGMVFPVNNLSNVVVRWNVMYPLRNPLY